jgi:hypothetical protein
MGNCSSTSKCNPCGPDFSAINQLATKAGAYARQANTYAVNAENSWLEFNALYLGAFAVAPTVDNEGDPLQVGALYWNTVSNTIFVWNGTTWVENGNFNEFTNFSLPSATPVPAANLLTGQEYEIIVVGTTNWTAIGAASATVGVRFTKNAVAATGNGTARVTRDLVTRFSDIGNVKDYGAIGNGIQDDSDAIQNAINSKTNIYFPPGTYRITKTILINRSFVSLYCDGPGTSYVLLDNNSVAIAIKYDAGIGTCDNNSIQNLTIRNTATTTYQIGVQGNKWQSFNMTDCDIAGFATCLDIRGSLNGFYSSIRVNTFTSNDANTNAGVIQISDNVTSGENYGYTHLFVNSSINGGVVIRGNDYVSFSNCYITPGKTGSGILIENDGSASFGNYNNNIDNCYFDRVANPNPNSIAINIKDQTSPPTEDAVGTKITDCVFTDWDTAVKIVKGFDPYIEIVGCKFIRGRGTTIDADGEFTNLVIGSNQFYNNTRLVSGSSNIDIKDVQSASITGNIFTYLQSDIFTGTRNAIKIDGLIKAISITGNTINTFALANVTDLTNTATITEFVVSGNSSDNANNTIVGSIIGNRENASSVSLDWYQEGFFLPELTFGGVSTGITYDARQCHYTRIGNRVLFDIYIDLSSKGTATGNCAIGNFPYPKSGSNLPVLHANLNGFDPSIGTTNLEALMPTSTTVTIVKYSGGGTVALTDADFTNSSLFSISGVYFV